MFIHNLGLPLLGLWGTLQKDLLNLLLDKETTVQSDRLNAESSAQAEEGIMALGHPSRESNLGQSQ